MRKKFFGMLAISTLTVIMLLAGCGPQQGTPEPTPSPTPSATAPAAAEFKVDALEVNSEQVIAGEPLDITATVTNTGDTAGSYAAGLVLDGNQVDNAEIDIAAGSTVEIPFSLTIESAGEHIVSLGDITASITALRPATLQVDDLQVKIGFLFPGEETEVKTSVTNAGEVKGSLEVVLNVNDIATDSQYVTLDSGASTELIFPFVRDVPGEYLLEINDTAASITVADAETYQSEQNFFYVAKPKGWTLEETGDEVMMSIKDIAAFYVHTNIIDSETSLTNLHNEVKKSLPEGRKDFSVVSEYEITLANGLDGYEIVGSYTHAQTGKPVTNHGYTVKNGRYLYYLEGSALEKDYADYEPIFDACLRSFEPPQTSTDTYTDTVNGFSVTMPNGWCGVATGDDVNVFRAYVNAGTPTIFSYIIMVPLTEEATAQEQAKDMADVFASQAEYKIVSHGPLQFGGNTEGYEYIITHKEGTYNIKRRIAATVRGSQTFILMAYTLDSTYQAKLPTINKFINSFTLVPPRPYGVSPDNSLFFYTGEIVTLDPALCESSPQDIIGAIFSGLVRIDKSLKVVPDLAESWEISEDGTIYTFHLREDAQFHNGKPVTATDFKYSWERVCDPMTDSPKATTFLSDIVGAAEMIAGQADEISGIKVIDDHTLEVSIDAPRPYFLSKLAYVTAYVVDKGNVQRGMNWTDAPNGTGPFKLKVWQKDKLLIMEKNEAFYRDASNLQNVVYKIYAGVPMRMYENSEIDMTGVYISNLDKVLDPANPLNKDLRETSNISIDYLGFNVSMAPFDDPNVRRAFAMALDIDKILEVTLDNIAEPAAGFLPPGIPGHNDTLPRIPYDPEAARQLINESKYGSVEDLPPVTLYTLRGLGDYQEAAIGMWQQNLGLTVEVEIIDEYEEWLKRSSNREFQLWFGGWRADYLDPQNFLDSLFHSQSKDNVSGYSKLDAQLEAAAVERDEQKRLEMYQEIEKQLLEDLPATPLWQSEKSYALAKPYFKGWDIFPIAINQWAEIYVEGR